MIGILCIACGSIWRTHERHAKYSSNITAKPAEQNNYHSLPLFVIGGPSSAKRGDLTRAFLGCGLSPLGVHGAALGALEEDGHGFVSRPQLDLHEVGLSVAAIGAHVAGLILVLPGLIETNAGER